MTPELSLILPVRNQADHIVDVVKKYQAVFRGRLWEILLVPNACRDDSPRLCRLLAARNRRIRVVENPEGGWGRSVRAGLAAAKGRYLGYTNSARTDPKTVPALFEFVRGRSEILAKAARRHRSQFVREMGSFVFNLECEMLFGLRMMDINGTPKIFPASILRRMRLEEDGDLLDAEILAWCRHLNVPIVEVGVEGWARHGGTSTTSIQSAMRIYLGTLALRRRLPW